MKNYLELSDIFHEKSLNEKLLDLAKRFKAYRKKAKLTQLQLSDKSGIPYGTLKRFERTGLISLRAPIFTVASANKSSVNALASSTVFGSLERMT